MANTRFGNFSELSQGKKPMTAEEARSLKALGIDTPEYDQLERLGNFYRVFFPK